MHMRSMQCVSCAHQAPRVGLGRDGAEVVAGDGDHDAPGRRIGAPRPHSAVRREGLVRPILVMDVLRACKERAIILKCMETAAWAAACMILLLLLLVLLHE